MHDTARSGCSSTWQRSTSKVKAMMMMVIMMVVVIITKMVSYLNEVDATMIVIFLKAGMVAMDAWLCRGSSGWSTEVPVEAMEVRMIDDYK